ncbi:hypothetical protein NCS13_1_0236 [Neochlamydia sp. S13]|nr:hypothetical protein NCS13_1_0236 [Neochlamydia sp. S13]
MGANLGIRAIKSFTQQGLFFTYINGKEWFLPTLIIGNVAKVMKKQEKYFYF